MENYSCMPKPTLHVHPHSFPMRSISQACSIAYSWFHPEPPALLTADLTECKYWIVTGFRHFLPAELIINLTNRQYLGGKYLKPVTIKYLLADCELLYYIESSREIFTMCLLHSVDAVQHFRINWMSAWGQVGLWHSLHEAADKQILNRQTFKALPRCCTY